MANVRSNEAVSRPPFVNGEKLRLDVQAPRSGGGTKYEPQTVEQAQRILGPQIQSVAEAVGAFKEELRG